MYIVLMSFSGSHGSFAAGQELETLPAGVDWLKAGFVEEAKPAKTDKDAKTPKKPTGKADK